jgi:hypothetical protein
MNCVQRATPAGTFARSYSKAAITRPASVGLRYPPLAVAPLAPGWVDSAAVLRGLLYGRKSSPLACRAFVLLRFPGLHFAPLKGLKVSKPPAERYQLVVVWGWCITRKEAPAHRGLTLGPLEVFETVAGEVRDIEKIASIDDCSGP